MSTAKEEWSKKWSAARRMVKSWDNGLITMELLDSCLDDKLLSSAKHIAYIRNFEPELSVVDRLNEYKKIAAGRAKWLKKEITWRHVYANFSSEGKWFLLCGQYEDECYEDGSW
jgi:hypothetical protein